MFEDNGSQRKDSHSHQNQPSVISNGAGKDGSIGKAIFVNHAELAWHEKRRHWVGNQYKKSKRMPRKPIMSWNTTYEDLLCSTDPFHQPIPLAEMVDFLVDIWHEEGLYD